MPDSQYSRHGSTVMGEFLQYLKAPLRLRHIDLLTVKYSDPGRIVPSVFQFGKTVKKDRGRLLFSNITYNTTHNNFLPSNL